MFLIMIDIEIVKFFNSINNQYVTFFSDIFSSVVFLIIFWLLICLIISHYDKEKGRKVFVAVMLAFFLHYCISEILFKEIIPITRIRPYIAYPNDITPIGELFTDSSFPSSHMSSSVAILTVLVYYFRKYWGATVIFALLMAFSRLYNGMHYLTDVLGGTVLGLIAGCLTIKLMKRYEKRKS